MKKLFFAVAAVAALTFASCGNKSNANAEAADSLKDSTMVDAADLAPETVSTFNALSTQLTDALEEGNTEEVTQALANLEAAYKTLANSGNLEEVKGYGLRVKKLIAEHEAKIKSVADGDVTIANLISGIEALPTSAEMTLNDAKNAVSNDVVDLASEALQRGAAAEASAEAAAEALKNAPAAAKEAAKEAAENAVSEAKNAANAAANEAANNARENVDNAANDAKQKAGAAIDDAASKVKGKLGL
jgi:hypothetical protein